MKCNVMDHTWVTEDVVKPVLSNHLYLKASLSDPIKGNECKFT